MRIKTFEIRVDPAFREHDERTVNEFLSAVRVPRLHCGCLRSRSAWTVAYTHLTLPTTPYV